jgi:triose/dihydroxyacetone kinase / FAD-AMP lyase (cyclizing)
MKKFLNRPENAVEEMLQGLAVLSPGVMRLPDHKVIFVPMRNRSAIDKWR